MEKSSKFLRRLANPYCYVLAVYFALLAVMYTIHPVLCDDINFREAMMPFLDKPSFANFISCAKERILTSWSIDNGRITQMISPVLLTTPKWITGPFVALCVVICIYYSARIADVWKKHAGIFGLLLLMWTVLMPWPDFMFTLFHSYNYIPPLAISLWLLNRYLSGRLKPLSALWICILISCWHELYGVMIVGMSTGMALFFKTFRNGTSVTMIIGSLIGIIYLALVPGASVRSGNIDMFSGFRNISASIVYGVPFIFFMIMTAVMLAVPSCRSRLSLIRLCCIAFAGISTFLMWRAFMMGPRVIWPTMAMSAIGICYLLTILPFRRFDKYGKAMGIMLSCASLLQLAVCLPWFVKMARDIDNVNNIQKNSEGNIFYDFTSTTDVPIYTLGKPNFVAYKAWTSHYRHVLPTVLKDFSKDEAQETCIIDGHKVYLYKGLILLEGITDNTPYMKLDFDGIKQVLYGLPYTFTAPDGKKYTYMYINHPIHLGRRQVTGVENIE